MKNSDPVVPTAEREQPRKYDYDRLTARPKDFIPRKLDAIAAKLAESTPYSVDRMAVLALAVDEYAAKLGIVI